MIEDALRELGAAFLTHPDNERLRTALHSGRLDADGYYHQLRRLSYRLLVLLMAGERKLLLSPLQPAADREDGRSSDLWPRLKEIVSLFGSSVCPDLQAAACRNVSLLRASAYLSSTGESAAGGRESFGQVERLGAIHERLLDSRAQIVMTEPDPTDRALRDQPGAPELRFALRQGGERKGSGSYYTPPDLISALLDVTLTPIMEEGLATAPLQDRERALLALRVCDPACGSGHFLLAAARRIACRLAQVRSGKGEPDHEAVRIALRDVICSCLYGVDQDPLAVDLCRAALWLEAADPDLPLRFLDGHVLCGEALICIPEVFAPGTFDVVLGNPPYLDSERLSREQPELRQRVAAAYPTARGNWDIYVPFVELAARLTRPGGMFALVTPSKLIASDYAATIQRLILDLTPTTCLAFGEVRPFADAQVSVIILAVRNSPGEPHTQLTFVRYGPGLIPEKTVSARLDQLRALPPGYLGAPLSLEDPALLTLATSHPRLASIATVSDGASTAEAYAIRDLVHVGSPRDAERDDRVRLVNTGTIEPFHTLWGTREISYLGFKGKYPVVARADLRRVAPRRLEQAERSKVVVGGMGNRIEAVAGLKGVLCGKSAILILPHGEVCPYALATVLNSRLINALYRALFGLRGFSARSMTIGPRQIERLPVPPEPTLAPYRGSDRLQSREVGELLELPDDALSRRVFGESLLSRLGCTLHLLLAPDEEDRSERGWSTSNPGGRRGWLDDMLDLAERSVALAFGRSNVLRNPDPKLRGVR